MIALSTKHDCILNSCAFIRSSQKKVVVDKTCSLYLNVSKNPSTSEVQLLIIYLLLTTKSVHTHISSQLCLPTLSVCDIFQLYTLFTFAMQDWVNKTRSLSSQVKGRETAKSDLKMVSNFLFSSFSEIHIVRTKKVNDSKKLKTKL